MADDGLMLSRDRHAVTASELVAEVAVMLNAAGVAQPATEARDMLAAIMDVPRFWPSINRGEPVADDIQVAVRTAAGKRARGAPFAYAVGRAPFRHIVLNVDERVLIPRQETELLVEIVRECMADRLGGTVVDVGTGSGAIALSLAAEGNFDRVIATDISGGALAVAVANHERLAGAMRCPVEFRHGSLLAPIHERVRAIVSNPPYIAFDEARELPSSVRDWEPVFALLSGSNGMRATAQLVRSAADRLEVGGILALEVDSRRASLAAELVATDSRFAGVSVRLDLTGRERFVVATRMEA
jgi:release factor glutamine methyltransferase